MSANIFGNVVLEDFEVESLLNDLSDNNTQQTNAQICDYCGSSISITNNYECPNCGVIIKVAPKRKEESQRIFLTIVESENKNGMYHIYKLQDGTFFCDCLSFLFQKGVTEFKGGLTCKHIRQFLNSNEVATNIEPQTPTTWQRVLLKKLGITPHEKLSREQAYWVIKEILFKIGVEYKEFINLLTKNPKYELLPIYAFGIELEGLIKSRNEMYQKMKDAGFKVVMTGYDHTIENDLWKVGDDGSVRRNMNDEEQEQFQSIELTSPKLFGDEGFKKIKKAIEIWDEIGGCVNNSCGYHIHIDAFNYNDDDLIRLLLVWMKIESVIYFLVSPSRRNNDRYAKMLRREIPPEIARLLLGINLDVNRDRYYALNRVAYDRYRTVEFRIHQGTRNFEKIKYWAVFCLKLMEKVKKGLKWYHFTENPTIEEVLDKVGIVENAVPLIRETRKYLIERYNYFKNESNGNYDLPELQLGGIKESLSRLLKDSYNSRIFVRGHYPRIHYKNFAAYIPRNIYSYEEIKNSRNGNTFKIRSSSNESRFYTVKYNPEDGRLTCTCRGFRHHGRCLHSINVARFICIEEWLEKVNNNLDF